MKQHNRTKKKISIILILAWLFFAIGLLFLLFGFVQFTIPFETIVERYNIIYETFVLPNCSDCDPLPDTAVLQAHTNLARNTIIIGLLFLATSLTAFKYKNTRNPENTR